MVVTNLPPDDQPELSLDDSDSEALHLAERIAKKLRDSRQLAAIREPVSAPNPRVATPLPG